MPVSYIFKFRKEFNSKINTYLAEFVYGGIDGCVTTFAVVSGASGADLPSTTVIILGLANLIADGFAMSVGSYLSAQSEMDKYHKTLNEITNKRHFPTENQKKELINYYIQKGLTPELAHQNFEALKEHPKSLALDLISAQNDYLPDKRSSFLKALFTFIAFILMGSIPMSVYFWDFWLSPIQNLFVYSGTFTLLSFAIIGWVKGNITKQSGIKTSFQTILLGSTAAILSFLVGYWLEGLK